MAKLLTRYRLIVESLGLRQLDVYRVREGGRDVDVLRLLDPQTGKVVTVNLGTVRESLSFQEFMERILEPLGKAGVRISDKTLSTVKAKIAEWSQNTAKQS